MTDPVRFFDQALSAALDCLAAHSCDIGGASPETTIVRDAFGGLYVVVPDEALAARAQAESLAAALHRVLGRYSPGERRVLLAVGDLIDADDVLASADRVRLPGVANTWLVDRLQTNQDWLRAPFCEQPPLPTAVACSIKGGVGRTTACAVWAWHLARAGQNVVVVDLDLESPGLGGVLLGADRLPDHGLIDWLVESLRPPVDEALLRDCLAECALAANAPGRIRVLPACGRDTREYISKLGRVYMPVSSADGTGLLGIAERLWQLLAQLARLPERPDAVLLDARAGLHDISSAAVTRLSAQVFLFARDEQPSWQAMRLLFEHLARARGVQWGMPEGDLRWRLQMVVAQAEIAERARLRARERCYELWEALYDSERPEADAPPGSGLVASDEASAEGAGDAAAARVFGPDDPEAPHQPLFIGFDPRLRTLDLADPEKRPDWQTIAPTFDGFLNAATMRLLSAQPDQRCQGFAGARSEDSDVRHDRPHPN